jgi:hypothetical protein
MQTTKTTTTAAPTLYTSGSARRLISHSATGSYNLIEMEGYAPAGCAPVQVSIIEARPTALRVRQGAHTAWLPACAVYIERGQWARDLHEGARVYVPHNLLEESGLRVVGAEQVGRERAYIRRRSPSQGLGKVQIVEDVAQYMDADAASDAGRFDEALASCSFETLEQIEIRARDGARYDVIAIEIASENNAKARAQIAAYALSEHISDLMQEKAFSEVVRECKHWMRAMQQGEDGLEEETRTILIQILADARHAANAARRSQPYRAAPQRAEEVAALAKAKPRRR